VVCKTPFIDSHSASAHQTESWGLPPPTEKKPRRNPTCDSRTIPRGPELRLFADGLGGSAVPQGEQQPLEHGRPEGLAAVLDVPQLAGWGGPSARHR